MRAIAAACLLGLASLPAAATPDCAAPRVERPLPQAPIAVAPVAPELASRTSVLGMPSGVLAPAYDPAQSLDRVLLRLRIEGCRDVARALPDAPAPASAGDPAAYRPQTAYDNTPWRFDMSQDGKRMTADEFDAWMKARGVRVAKGAAAPAQPATPPAGDGQSPAPASDPQD